MEWPVVHIVDSIAASAIIGIEDAIVERNSKMHLSDKPAIIAKYNMEMFLLVKFLDIIFVPNLSRLDLRERLQPVRNHLYEHLSKFPRAEVRHEKYDSFRLTLTLLYLYLHFCSGRGLPFEKIRFVYQLGE